MKLIRLTNLSKLLLALVLVTSVTSCAAVDQAVGTVFGKQSAVTQAVDTPLKQWAVVQQALSAATDTAAGAMEANLVPLDVAKKIAIYQHDAQSALDEAFDAISSSAAKTKSGLTWQEALNIAKSKTASIQSIIEVFKK